MAPLVLVLLFAFFFVIALSLVVWAALTLGEERNPVTTAADGRAASEHANGNRADRGRAGGERAGRGRSRDTREGNAEKKESRKRQRLAPKERREHVSEPLIDERPAVRQGRIWEDAQGGADDEPPAERPGAEARKNRATVTPREPTGDAFERFLQNEERRR